MARPILALLALTLVACGSDDSGPFLVDARIITADEANPLSVGEFDTLRITWAQEGFDTVTQEVDLDSDTFEVPFDLDPIAPARARVELLGPSGPLHGAPPSFSPLASGGFLWVVVGEPGSCALVSRFEGPGVARANSAYVRTDGFVVQLGGVAASGPSASVTFSDLYWASAGASEIPSLLALAGKTTAVLLNPRKAIVLAERGGPWTYDLDGRTPAEDRVQPFALHSTASIASALARTSTGAVLVAGGGDAASPSRELARIGGDGAVVLGGLLGARAFAGAAPAGEADIVVAGGTRAAGAPFVEWVDMATLATIPLNDPAAGPVRNEPLVIAGESSHWIVGGTDESGAPITTSWILSGCPDACVLTSGPGVDLGPAPSAEGTTVTDGTTVFVAMEVGGWRLEPLGDLIRERRGSGIARLESGVVFVHGGEDEEGPHLDAELCFPAELSPL